MTAENRCFITLDEILALELECCKCRTRIVLEPSRWEKDKIPNRCPSCAAMWWATGSDPASDSVENTIHAFLQNGRRLVMLKELERKSEGKPRAEFYHLGCNLTLDINNGGPEEAKAVNPKGKTRP